jgi:hypothetical protein
MKVTILVLVCSLASTLLCLAQTGTPVIGGDYGGGMVFDLKEVKTSTTCKKEIYICSKMDDPKQYKYQAEHGQLTKDFNNDPIRNVGFNDWYIPSNNELIALYENLHKKGWGGFNQIEYASNNLFRIVFKTGEKFGSLNPIHSYSTRMVRKVTENCSGAAPCEGKDAVKKYQTSSMKLGDKLQENEKLMSANGRFQLRGTLDGNFVIEELVGPVDCPFSEKYRFPLPHSGGETPKVSFLRYGADGNVCVVSKQGKWNCATDGLDAMAVILNKSVKLELTDEGRLILVDSNGNEIWHISPEK